MGTEPMEGLGSGSQFLGSLDGMGAMGLGTGGGGGLVPQFPHWVKFSMGPAVVTQEKLHSPGGGEGGGEMGPPRAPGPTAPKVKASDPPDSPLLPITGSPSLPPPPPSPKSPKAG